MKVGVCQLSLLETQDLMTDKHLVQRLKQKIFERFKIPIIQVKDSALFDGLVIGFAVVANEEDFVRSTIDKIEAFIEESEGLRVSRDKIQVLSY